MFGYVTINKPELKIKEYEAYKGVYCTLCKEMGKEYGLLSRFLLSYDGAFYVMYKLGLSEDKINVSNSRCSFNPCKKCMKITCENNVYKLACAITVILAYFKLVDNLHDSDFLKRIFLYVLYPYFSLIKNKAKKKYPDVFEIVNKGMTQQFALEKDDDVSPDKSAHPTADILSQLFALGEKGETQENAKQFGYQLGRVVYFLDAFDDYEKDLKENTFNPFKNCDDIVGISTHIINMSIGALTETFNKQNFNNFSSIIENIIYDGLSLRMDKIIQKYRGEVSE
jgi:translation initiation factor 2 beta subunit (eIF-2beta)/eIF-5